MAVPTVYVVDDSPYWANAISHGLRSQGYDVTTFNDALTAVEKLRTNPPTVLVTDFFMAHLDGGKLCALAKSLPTKQRVLTIIVTGGADRSIARLPERHADAVVAKNAVGILLQDLTHLIRELLANRIDTNDKRVIGYERLQPRVLTNKLHGLKRYLEALQNGIGDAVFAVDSQLRLYVVNTIATDLVGQPEEQLIARRVDEVLGLDPRGPLVHAIEAAVDFRKGSTGPLTEVIFGHTMRVTVAGLESPDGKNGAVIIARDISDLLRAEKERTELQARLYQGDKMSALGQLTAGICHEINNPLAALLPNLKQIQEYCGVLLEKAQAQRLGSSSLLDEVVRELPELMNDSVEAAQRIASITVEMREFAEPRPRHGERRQVEELLESALSLASSELRFKANVEKRYGVTSAIVVEPHRLRQTFLNIILNAVQAFTGSEDNRIILETSRQNDGVEIRISNNGPHIPVEIQKKIFEPFFTTKAVNQGTGLGLTISYDTVRRHGGTLEVHSVPGEFTTFCIWLPTETGVLESYPGESPTAPPAKSAQVLIVDDERLLLNSFRRQLEVSYRVRVAGNARQALEILEKDGRFDAVICDLLMPEMTGMELFATMQARDPEQSRRFIFLTGGTFTPAAREFLSSVDNPRAFKPIEGQELRRLVAESLVRWKGER